MRPSPRNAWAVPLTALGLALAPAAGAAQAPDNSAADRPLATRQELETLRASSSDSSVVERVRTRLAEGDFRPGDKVLVEVQNDTALSDTFSVWPDQALHLPSPTVGSLPMRGVLRSELQPHVQRFVERFVRNAVVRARPLLRLSIQGEVVRAGYYGVPPDARFSEALMAAGGTTPNANVGKARVERQGRPVLQGRPLEAAIASGSTLEDAGVREGDQLFLPRRGTGFQDNLRFVWLLVSLAGGVFALSRAF